MSVNKIARNDPCPCGSGKKYKQCCLQSQAAQPAVPRPAPLDVSRVLQMAAMHLEGGHLIEAEAACQQVLQQSPNHPDALYLMGMIAYQAGMHDVAEVFLGSVIEAAPRFADAHINLGVVFMAQGKFDEAAACFRQADSLQPRNAHALFNLGNALKELGQLDEAVACYRKAASITPAHARLYNNLGDALQSLGKLDEAEASYRQAIAIDPSLAEVHYNLGDIFKEQDKRDESILSYRQAIALKPDYAEAWNNLGNLLKKQGSYAEAIEHYRKAIELRPAYAEAHHNLGDTLFMQGHLNEALASCRLATHLKTDFAEALTTLAKTLKEQGQLEEALTLSRQAMQINPDYVEACNTLGNTLQAQGKLEEAIACFRQIISGKKKPASVYSNLLYTMQYLDTVTPAEVFAEHQRYAEHFETPFKPHWQAHENNRDPERRLRIGYVSGDFFYHAVAFFIEPILANHDKSQVEVFCYFNNFKRDTYTDRIAAHADHWLDVSAMCDEQLAERIRADGIDILVDLSGHTGFNRLPMFARKPAPVQATWIGYAGSTGLTAMDYRITNAEMDPPGLTERYHSETLLRMPDTGVAYQPHPDSPPVNALPALSSGEFVFASLNNLIKINPSVVRLWARILEALPHARLMLGNVTDSSVQQRMVEQFAQAGVSADRLILLPRLSFDEYLSVHQRIDMALDPYPYNGGTTTMNSLWMGVPVLSLAGEHMVSRCAVPLLTRVGLTDFIAGDEEDYFNRAIRFAQDLPGLDRVRQSLRDRMSASNQGPQAVTRDLEAAYRDIWRKWCATAQPGQASIRVGSTQEERVAADEG